MPDKDVWKNAMEHFADMYRWQSVSTYSVRRPDLGFRPNCKVYSTKSVHDGF